MRYLIYGSMDENGDYVEIKKTQQEAIREQRDIALKSHGYSYESDQMALDDYIAVNWAFWRDEL